MEVEKKRGKDVISFQLVAVAFPWSWVKYLEYIALYLHQPAWQKVSARNSNKRTTNFFCSSLDAKPYSTIRLYNWEQKAWPILGASGGAWTHGTNIHRTHTFIKPSTVDQSAYLTDLLTHNPRASRRHADEGRWPARPRRNIHNSYSQFKNKVAFIHRVANVADMAVGQRANQPTGLSLVLPN